MQSCGDCRNEIGHLYDKYGSKALVTPPYLNTLDPKEPFPRMKIQAQVALPIMFYMPRQLSAYALEH